MWMAGGDMDVFTAVESASPVTVRGVILVKAEPFVFWPRFWHIQLSSSSFIALFGCLTVSA